MGFLIRHYCGWSTVPPPEAGHTALCSHAVASFATHPTPTLQTLPSAMMSPRLSSREKLGGGTGARGMLESSRELSLVDCSWGASIPCLGLSYPFLCVEYSSLKTTRFSHRLLKLPPRGRVSVATGGTWLWYPSCRLWIPWGSRAFGSVV